MIVRNIVFASSVVHTGRYKRASKSIRYCGDGQRLEQQCNETPITHELGLVAQDGERIGFLDASFAIGSALGEALFIGQLRVGGHGA